MMKKRLFSLLLCAALALSLCPTALAADGSGGTISDGTGEAGILGCLMVMFASVVLARGSFPQ